MVFVVISTLYLVLVWQTVRWSEIDSRDDLQDSAVQKLRLYVAHLHGELAKYEFLPNLVASNELLGQLLTHPQDSPLTEQVNLYLQQMNEISGTSNIYLMDRSGLTLAASNWNDERSFVGKNFAYRPYFKQALEGRLGRYFALGATSIRRGYYFAYKHNLAFDIKE